MKRFLAWVLTVALVLTLCPAISLSADAETEVNYEYHLCYHEDTDMEGICIHGADGELKGDIIIPSMIDGYPVLEIDGWAFSGFEELTSVTIPATICSIGACALGGAKVFVDENNTYYTSDSDGVLYSKDKTVLVQAPRTISGEYTISSGVTTIGTEAFTDCADLTKVVIPEGLTAIGEYAFNDINLQYVNLPESLTTIGEGAFRYTDLARVEILSNVTFVGEKAFFGCGLENGIQVDPNNTVYCSEDGILFNKDKTILMQAPTAIYGSYTIPDSVITVANGAFGHTSLYEVVITDQVQTLEDDAFWNCGLGTVIIGKGLTSIGADAFGACYSLKEFIVSEENTAFCNDEVGALYNKTKTVLMHVPSNVPSYTIPDSVTKIGSYAFSGCDRLTSLLIPEGVTEIGWSAVYSVANLVAVQLPVSLTYVGYENFAWSSSLTDIYYMGTQEQWEQVEQGISYDELTVHFGEAMPEIPLLPEEPEEPDYPDYPDEPEYPDYMDDPKEGIFYYQVDYEEAYITGCDKDVEGNVVIPDTIGGYPVIYIGYGAFEDCYGITSVTIPDSVYSIGEYAFGWCENLETVTIGEGVEYIAYGAFQDCASLTDVYYNGTMAQWNGIEIGSDNECLLDAAVHTTDEGNIATSGTFGEGFSWSVDEEGTLTVSGTGALEVYYGDDRWEAHTRAIKKIVIGQGITEIANWYFGNMPQVQEVVVADSVTRIGEYAFYGCEKLERVTFGKNLKTIGNEAFAWTAVSQVTIPASVTEIGQGAFENCFYTVETGNKYYSSDNQGILFNADKTTLICAPKSLSGEYRIPDGVTQIAERAFAECYDLSEVILPDSVTSIEWGAFLECGQLRSVTLSKNLKSIAGHAFAWTDLQEIQIPASVDSIAEGAFANCGSLSGIWVDENNTVYSSDDQGVLFDKQQTVLLQAPKTISGSYPVPGTVKEIAYEAFDDCDQLVDVIIREGVTQIGEYAFYDCESLRTVSIPNSITSVGSCAFYRCENLQYNTYDNALYLGNESNPYILLVAAVDEEISSCQIHEKTKLIGDSAFACCESLGQIVIPEGVLEIGSGAFSECKMLQTIEIPASVRSIGYGAFAWSESLESVTLHEGLQAIDHEVFANCGALKTITIPNSVTQLGNYVFDNCTALTDVTIGDGVEMLYARVFSRCENLARIRIGKGVLSIAWRTCFELPALESIWVDPANGMYSSDEHGVLFSKDKSELIQAPKLISGSYTIPATVTQIVYSAFTYCANLTSVSIPESVTAIEGGTFGGCTALTDVSIPSSIEKVNEYSFAECVNLKYNTSGNGNYLGNAQNPYVVLMGGISQEIERLEIPSGARAIYGGAFSGYDGEGYQMLKEVTMPDSLVSIGNQAFAACTALEKVTFGKGLTEIGQMAFAFTPLQNVVLGQNVKTISYGAFGICQNLKTVTIPKTVTLIEEDAFYECEKLTDVYYSGTRAQWDRIWIGEGNQWLTDAVIHCSGGAGGQTSEAADVDGVAGVNVDDAIYLLQSILMPDLFPVEKPVDFNGDDAVNVDDAIYLLQHILMPDLFPLQ